MAAQTNLIFSANFTSYISCFEGNTPVFMATLIDNVVVAQVLVTTFTASVDPEVFSVPSTCQSSLKLHAAPLRAMFNKKMLSTNLFFKF